MRFKSINKNVEIFQFQKKELHSIFLQTGSPQTKKRGFPKN